MFAGFAVPAPTKTFQLLSGSPFAASHAESRAAIPPVSYMLNVQSSMFNVECAKFKV